MKERNRSIMCEDRFGGKRQSGGNEFRKSHHRNRKCDNKGDVTKEKLRKGRSNGVTGKEGKHLRKGGNDALQRTSGCT